MGNNQILNKKTFDLSEKHLNILKLILKKYPYKFFAFGSRVKQNAKPNSDIDLCYKDIISMNELMNLKQELIDSDLPYKVDLVDFNSLNENVKQLIEKDLLEIV